MKPSPKQKVRKVKAPATGASFAAKLVEEIYDELAAKMLVALYREKARAIKSLESRFKF